MAFKEFARFWLYVLTLVVIMSIIKSCDKPSSYIDKHSSATATAQQPQVEMVDEWCKSGNHYVKFSVVIVIPD